MALKELIIKLFPGIYIQKNFSELEKTDFSNYRKNNTEPELLLLPYLLKRDKLFIDVGSNKGAFLFLASKILQPDLIFGFEPNPMLFNKIRNVFKEIKIFNCALSDKTGSAVLTIPYTEQQPDDSLGTLNTSEVNNNAFNFKVELKTLDTCTTEFGSKIPGLIKIDVEGHELDVLKGAEALIKKHQPILIVEIEQRHHDVPVKNIIENLVKQFSYTVYYFLPLQNKLVNFNADTTIYQDKKDFGTINYVNNFIFIVPSKETDQLVDTINSEIEKQTGK